MGLGSGFFDMVGKIPTFTASPDAMDKEDGSSTAGEPIRKFKDPSVIIEQEASIIFKTRKEEEWLTLGMLDGFNKPEQEKLSLLYNEILENEYIWNPTYKSLYLIAANYAMRALKADETLAPSTREKLIKEFEAERFIVDMNKVLDGVSGSMKKFFPNSNSEFGIMCLFAYTYVGEIIANEMAMEIIKNEIFK
jgi:hypothetical protein